MKSIATTALIASMAASFAPIASAVVLDFEGLSNVFFSTDYQGYRFGNNGGSVSNDWFADPGPSPSYIRASGNVAIGFSPVAPSGNLDLLESLPITKADGGDFFLAGAFFSGFDFNSTNAPGSAQIYFKLYNNGSLVGTSAVLTPNTTTAQFLSTAALASTVIDAFTVVGPAPFFLMDDLNVTPVPEPATYGLMALGLAGVGAMVRRQKTQ